MADPAIHKSQLADPSSTHPVHDDEDVDEADVEVAYVTGDSELTYVSGKTGWASKTDGAGQIPRNDFVDFLVYQINGTIVDRYQNQVYATNSENLIRRLDTRSEGFEWILEFQWVNESNTDNTYGGRTHDPTRPGDREQLWCQRSFQGAWSNRWGLSENLHRTWDIKWHESWKVYRCRG